MVELAIHAPSFRLLAAISGKREYRYHLVRGKPGVVVGRNRSDASYACASFTAADIARHFHSGWVFGIFGREPLKILYRVL